MASSVELMQLASGAARNVDAAADADADLVLEAVGARDGGPVSSDDGSALSPLAGPPPGPGAADADDDSSSLSSRPSAWHRRLRARLAVYASFIGPGHLVAVGYMDPGNWATDIAAGSQFGYALLVVVLLSSLGAVFVQVLCLRLGIATGSDLAQYCRLTLHERRPWAVWTLWALAEVAIIATDMAEVIGSAIALNLLFGLPLAAGVAITALDVLVILAGLQNKATLLEWLVVLLVTTVFAAFVYMLSVSPIDWKALALGYLPSAVLFTDGAALYTAVGIIGATIMPHNLYLHSAVARDHAAGHRPEKAMAYSAADVAVSLTVAFVVNSAILIVAASNFYASGNSNVASIQDAYALLQTLVGPAFATVFAVSLLLSGQSSTVTGTLAGQVVAEGFINWRVRPWVRRLVTRLAAIVPALVVVLATGAEGLDSLLVLSQVVLSMQLPFAVFPLVYFTSSPAIMGHHVNRRWVKILGYAVASLLAGLNVFLLVQVFISL